MSYPFVQAHDDYGLRNAPTLAFVVHMAEGGGTVGYLSRPQPRGVSVHYVIEQTGRIVQMLLESHASGSIDPTRIRTGDGPEPYGASVARAVLGLWMRDPNRAVLSCEIEGFAAAGPNDRQVAALHALVNDIRGRYPRIGLLGHRDFADYKACPGAHIPWALLGGHGPAGDDMAPLWDGYDETPRLITVPEGVSVLELDGRTRLATLSVPLTDRLSPYGVTRDDGATLRAFSASIAGVKRLALVGVTPDMVADVPAAIDCSEPIREAIAADRLRARVTYDPL